MKKKRTGRSRVWLFVVLAVVAALLAYYYLGREKGSSEKKGSPVKPETPTIQQEVSETAVQEETSPKEEAGVTEVKEAVPPRPEDRCRRIEGDVREFFRYLDKKNYVQHLEEGSDTYQRFKGIIGRLSSQTPIPAGEGIDVKIITRNIFHFFRVLDRNDLRLIKEVMRNEADTLELNLDLFYTWLMLGDQCSDPEGIRPSLEVRYLYAGFFLNTIGGRAYIFRRPSPIRLLISYYSLLIIHEADKKGVNSYGLDILPHLSSIEKEITIYPEFHFKEEYLQELKKLSKYYLEKR